MAALGSHAITEDGQRGSKNKDGRKRHPYRRPQVTARLPRVPHTERNALYITLPESKKPITGHIDVLQARNGFIHLLDYKPKAREIDPVKPVGDLCLGVRLAGPAACESLQVRLV